MNISGKLLTSFLGIAALTLVVGIIGFISLTEVNSEHEALFQEHGVTQGLIGKAESDFLSFGISIRDMVMDKNTLLAQEYADDMKALDADLQTQLGKYKKLLVTQGDLDQYGAIVAAIDKERSFREQIIKLCLAGKNDEAYALMRSADSLDATAAAKKLLSETIDDKVVLADQESDRVSAYVNEMIWLLISVAVIAVLLAATLGILISRSISRPIHTIVQAAKKLAVGDTDIRLSIKGKDETAQLGDAFAEVVAALKRLIADTTMLSQAAVDGKLATRADVSTHQGDYRRILDGVNGTLDAVIEPINEAAAVLKEMSMGNLSSNVTGDYRGDHAAIKNALNDTINTIKGYITEIAQVLTEVAGGNLGIGISRDYRGEFIVIKESINHIVDSLNEVLGEISNAAEQVASGTQQVSSGSQALSQGATEQASAIEELSAAVTEIAAQTKQNAMDAGHANMTSAETREHALTGNQQMNAMLSSMNDINEASANISRIIKVIDDIAFQTNLLALNAAVEAARAGQHGKGFAVVAEEVRNLAARSANAAKETTAMIEGSMHKAAEGTRIANETAQALGKIVAGVEKATDLVGSITKASNEQASSVAQINRGIEQVSQVVQTNSATAEQSAAASEELSSQAILLKDMVGRFTLRRHAAHASPKNLAGARTLPASPSPQKPKISLNSTEFGKYSS